jgi:hypothetical protein
MRNEISNTDDVIDSRDVIERIEELEAIALPIHNVETGEDELDPNVTDDERADAVAELALLKTLAEEAEGYAPDWQYGEMLVRDSYFTDYARELLEDCGDIPKNLPHYIEIDWDATARNIQQDYTSVEFDGVTYWIR